MAEFLSTRGISLKLEEIIKSAKTELYIITPYLKFSQPIFEQFKRVSRNIDFKVIYGKTELKANEDKLLNDLNCNIYYKDNLHAKCYANEYLALVCSMNLHSFSEVNNYEMGILLNSREDKSAYIDCMNEIDFIETNSIQMRILTRGDLQVQKYTREELYSAWVESMKSIFSSNKIENINNILRIYNFPIQNINLETGYGIATFVINLPEPNCFNYKEFYGSMVYNSVPDYRIFWNAPYNKMHLYCAKKKQFISIKEEIDYYKKGLLDLINILSKCNFK